METKSFLSLLSLLLLSLSHANPLLEDRREEEIQVDDLQVIDGEISSRILSTNNGSREMLLEGDMIIPRTRNAMGCWNNYCRWQKDSTGYVKVPFTVNSAFSHYERQKIEYALGAFHSRTCLRFVPRENEYDYISIENLDGCFSSLGRVGGEQVLSLNRQGCVHHGVIQHEVLHALGFQHEQTRSDRDQHVRINWEVIEPAMAFNFYKQQTINLDTPYDYSSIMHYGRTAFSTQYGRDSITPIPDSNVRIGQRNGLSDMDILRINRLYDC